VRKRNYDLANDNAGRIHCNISFNPLLGIPSKMIKITDDELRAELMSGASKASIARKYNVDIRNIHRRCAYLAKKGFSPQHDMTKEVPDGFMIKGTSTLYRDGEQAMQWVKTSVDNERQLELMREAVSAMCEEITPIPPSKIPEKTGNDNLLNCYVITDYHLGMMAWHEETGNDWDIKIAEELIYKWFDAAIETSPQAGTAVFAQLGDFMHWDGLDAVTPTSRHVLDADTRFQKLVRVSIRVIRRIIDKLLSKYQKVVMIQPGGNHDPASTIWLREMFYALYDNDPRVIVDRTADLYCCYEHGATSLFFHHGHKRRVKNIDHVFASKFREVFGRTQYSYAHMGHYHTQIVEESNLMIIEQHPTLAGHDAYAAQNGYLSKRNAKRITYHKKFGEVSRETISPQMLED
jgi:hypothetical protein